MSKLFVFRSANFRNVSWTNILDWLPAKTTLQQRPVMKNPSTNLKNTNIDMDKLCCSLRVQSIPEYGNEAAQRAVL